MLELLGNRTKISRLPQSQTPILLWLWSSWHLKPSCFSSSASVVGTNHISSSILVDSQPVSTTSNPELDKTNRTPESSRIFKMIHYHERERNYYRRRAEIFKLRTNYSNTWSANRMRKQQRETKKYVVSLYC